MNCIYDFVFGLEVTVTSFAILAFIVKDNVVELASLIRVAHRYLERVTLRSGTEKEHGGQIDFILLAR